MTLDKYLKKTAMTMQALAERSGVSYNTIKSVRRGMKLSKYSVAKQISDATGGKVTVKELCE